MPATYPSGRPGKVAGVLETVYLVLLVAGFGLVAWSAAVVLHRLHRGQH
jgi:type IV secretory pathway TrbD component